MTSIASQNESKGILRHFHATAARLPKQQALGIVAEGEVVWYTWKQLADLVEAERIKLRQQGLRPGVGVPMPEHNSLDWPVRNLAIWAEGGVLLPPDYATNATFDSSVAAMVSTSGTGAMPKQILLSHENLASNATAVSTVSKPMGDNQEQEVRLSFLPFSHLYARTCDLYTWIVRGSRLVLAENRETIFRDCRIVQPTVINGVPYFYQKTIDLSDSQGIALRELLGNKIKRCYTGGAALAPLVEAAFFDAGIPLYNGYGMTEASPVVTISTPDAFKRGTVGRPLPDVEVRISEDNEVLVRGPNIMLGYTNESGRIDTEETHQAIRDDWLHTGDLGSVDSDGYLTLTGRKKELIALATGKKVSPSRVESLLSASPWIEQAAIFGEGKKGLVALVVPNKDRLRSEIKQRRLWVWSKRRALNHPHIRDLYQQIIGKALKNASKEEQVHEFHIIGRGFSQELGEMTKKLSLRRAVIAKNFRL